MLANPDQTYTLYNVFNNTPGSSHTQVAGVADISSETCPKMVLRIDSSTEMPFIRNLEVWSSAITNEKSFVKFSYHAKKTDEKTYTSVRFKAVLKTTIPGITPELANYRVKIS